MSGICYQVPATSRDNVRAAAREVRDKFELGDDYFPIIDFLELALPRVVPEFVFLVGEPADMGNDHGQTWPDEWVIRIRQDIYERAHEGRGRDRLTLAHELGHLLLHRDIPMARAVGPREIERFRSSEWQANCFAGELLFPATKAADYPDPAEAAVAFGISEEAARTQIRAYRKKGLI